MRTTEVKWPIHMAIHLPNSKSLSKTQIILNSRPDTCYHPSEFSNN